jgi:hypothetical protein
VSVLRLSILTSVLLSISGCGILNPFSKPEVKQVEIQTKAVERTKLNLKLPPPLEARAMDWYVVTPDNIDEVWDKLREQNTDLVLFALTDEGYEQLALTIAEVRNMINSQRVILLKYREYYEPQEQKEPKQQ